jgi:hypothetical protein
MPTGKTAGPQDGQQSRRHAGTLASLQASKQD